MSKTQAAIHHTEEEVNRHIQAQGKTFIWHQIYAPNDEASIDFYTKALGWGRDEYDMGPDGKYKMLTNLGSGIVGIVNTADKKHPELKDIPPHWSITIGVDDVDATAKKCESLGAKVLQGPFDIEKIGRMALIQDPQGATFWLMKPMGM